MYNGFNGLMVQTPRKFGFDLDSGLVQSHLIGFTRERKMASFTNTNCRPHMPHCTISYWEVVLAGVTVVHVQQSVGFADPG